MKSKGIKNKGIIIALIVFFIVLIMGVLIFPHFKKGFTGQTTPVFMLNSDIKERTLITEDMIKNVDFPSEYIKDSKIIVSDKNEIINAYSKVAINKNDIISKDKITNKDDVALYSKGNLIAVTVSTLSSSVAGKIYPGDIVKVYGYIKEETETGIQNKVIAPKDLEKMEVAYILTSQAQDTTNTENNKTDIVPNVVVLKVSNEKQASALVNLEYSGKIHLEKINN
ncbi:Flp pilus assembly protein CpaB [Peptoanaerobacter stomatis]